MLHEKRGCQVVAPARRARDEDVPESAPTFGHRHPQGRHMRKLCALAVVMASVIAPASRVSAGEYGDLRTKLSAARAELITLLLHKDKRGPDQQKKVKDTADAVSAQLATMRAPAGKEAQFNELKEAWEAFKHTRETELVPAILKGEQEKAEKIAGGIQKERITKCQKLVSEIEISSGK